MLSKSYENMFNSVGARNVYVLSNRANHENLDGKNVGK